MCVNYRPPSPELFATVARIMVDIDKPPAEWKLEVWKDYAAPIVRQGPQGREGLLATYGMVPRKRIPPGVRSFDTLNARSETVGQLRSFSGAWKKSQLCLVPMTAFYEPCYETGKNVWMGIGMADATLFAVAEMGR
jgi:putative SOS response-associated peptidase YedK